VGFDEIPFAAYTTPGLTTASIPIDELGRQGWERLSVLINGQPPGYDLSFGPVVIARVAPGRGA
jgi:LacI family transcriptional regulator